MTFPDITHVLVLGIIMHNLTKEYGLQFIISYTTIKMCKLSLWQDSEPKCQWIIFTLVQVLGGEPRKPEFLSTDFNLHKSSHVDLQHSAKNSPGHPGYLLLTTNHMKSTHSYMKHYQFQQSWTNFASQQRLENNGKHLGEVLKCREILLVNI